MWWLSTMLARWSVFDDVLKDEAGQLAGGGLGHPVSDPIQRISLVAALDVLGGGLSG